MNGINIKNICDLSEKEKKKKNRFGKKFAKNALHHPTTEQDFDNVPKITVVAVAAEAAAAGSLEYPQPFCVKMH